MPSQAEDRVALMAARFFDELVEIHHEEALNTVQVDARSHVRSLEAASAGFSSLRSKACVTVAVMSHLKVLERVPRPRCGTA